jgi:hypothetical protein
VASRDSRQPSVVVFLAIVFPPVRLLI